LRTRKTLADGREMDSAWGMIRPGFLSREERAALIELARDGSVTHRLARRANALVLLDDGLSCEQVAKVLLLDDDTVRRWHSAFAEGGRKALLRFETGGSACNLSQAQQEKLVAWVRATSPRSTREVGAWITSELDVEYDSRSGLVALLHRVGLEYRKPEVIPRHLDENKQRAFIDFYEKLMNSLSTDEIVVFADAVHPTHAARAAGCWAAKDETLAIEQTTGRQRLNIHGAIDLETGQTRMIEAEVIDAATTIKLLVSLETFYSTAALIHVFLDNARYHHAKIVREWLSQPERRIALHFVPSYCPHLNPIERLWALMHGHLTHNKTYPTAREFADALLGFLRYEVPAKWAAFCDSVTDNFRVISPAKFRILA
jgi:transposase